MRSVLFAAIMLTSLLPGSTRGAGSDSLFVYIGTYTSPRSRGIYLARFDSGAGKLTPARLVFETKNPSFLALHPNGRFLYAVGELDSFEGKKGGAVNAFSIERSTGKLSLLNQQGSGGAGPCHLVVDPTGRCVLVANYGGGSIAALPVGADGRLASAATFIQHHGASFVNRQRQEGPHAHSAAIDAANRLAFFCDLGLDQVLLYRFNAERALLSAADPAAVRVEPGSGPRHLAFHPNGRLVYVINELNSTITAFRFDAAQGSMKAFQTISTLPDQFNGSSTCAEIAVHPSGKFLYGSNRGHDSLAAFAIDGEGKLTLVEHQPTQGKTPRHFAVVPGGDWLLAENQDSDSVVVFAVDRSSGRLKPNGEKIEVGRPVCVTFVQPE